MIKQDIKIHKESYAIQSSSSSSFLSTKLPTCLKDSKAARVANGSRMPTEEQYNAALEVWKTKHITAVGQKIYITYGPHSGVQERIFAGILPREKAHFQNYGHGPETQIIEIWAPMTDYFSRVCPTQCSSLNKG